MKKSDINTTAAPGKIVCGQTLDNRFLILEEIGQGSMGKVYKAKDLLKNSLVALKIIKPHLSTDPGFQAQLDRELLLAKELNHENVVRIHDLGEIANLKYISMTFIHGKTLHKMIRLTGKLPAQTAVNIFRQVCRAAGAAHAKGIIHRDLKPHNIIIDKTSKAYVMDFGIALFHGAAEDSPGQDIVIGTPEYMAPEQIKGEYLDAGADIYSLGIIFYEMLTGRLPFAAKNHRELLFKQLTETPEPPSTWNPHIPLHLENVILKCLEKKKENRYLALEEVLQDIGAARAPNL